MLRYFLLALIIVLIAASSYLFLRSQGYLSQPGSSSGKSSSLTPSPNEANVENLVEKEWSWVDISFSDGNSVTPLTEGAFLIRFMPDGSVSASTDCNTFMGSYTTVAPNNITIITNASTLMACPESQEAEFIEAFNRASTFSIDGESLNLGLNDGSQMNFE